VLEGNVCALLAATDHVNIFLYDGGIVPDPEGILRIGRNQLYQVVARGQLSTVRIGRSIRIPQEALLDLLTSGSPQGRVSDGE
jgi:excisionase family DNA binding protein